jgi:hypothetical protein
VSRFYYDGNDSEYCNLDWGRWENNLKQILHGKRGQKVLADLEAALLALPEPRLIEGAICEVTEGEDGATKAEYCVIGAYAAAKGKTPDELAQLGGVYKDEMDEATADLGVSLGMPRTLAWHLGDMNDQAFGESTPEERYNRMLRWVQEQRRIAA